MSKKLNFRQACWSLYLSQFNFTLHHQPSHSMGELFQRANHGTGAEDNMNMILLCPEHFTIWALEGLTVIGEERDILHDIQKVLWGGEKEDSVVKVISELHQGSGKTVRTAEWSELEGLLHFWGKVYVPNNPELWHWIVSQHHDTRIACGCWLGRVHIAAPLTQIVVVDRIYAGPSTCIDILTQLDLCSGTWIVTWDIWVEKEWIGLWLFWWNEWDWCDKWNR